MRATMPPSCVCAPALPPPFRAVTTCSPSIITIFDCSGANGALLEGSVKLLVVPVSAGRHRSICVPSG